MTGSTSFLTGCDKTSGFTISGRVTKVVNGTITAEIPLAKQGHFYQIHSSRNEKIMGQCQSIDHHFSQIVLYGPSTGISVGDEVTELGPRMPVMRPENISKCTLNGWLAPIEGPTISSNVPRKEVNILSLPTASNITKAFSSGIPWIDLFFTLGYGQKLGIFAEPGAGKTSLILRLAQSRAFDHLVLVLLGERTREIALAQDLLRTKSPTDYTIIAAAANTNASERANCAPNALKLALQEALTGKHILLLLDSITRWARAVRETTSPIGVSSLSDSLPLTVLQDLPPLFEMCGNFGTGSVTGIFTVLNTSPNRDDLLSEEIKSLLDGHIYLSAALKFWKNVPGVNWKKSCSRSFEGLNTIKYTERAHHWKQFICDAVEKKTLENLTGVTDVNSEPTYKKLCILEALLNRYENESYSLAQLQRDFLASPLPD